MSMFSGKRYATHSIDSETPLALQLLLWKLIDEKKTTAEPLDYLQVFELSPQNKDGKAVQQIIHRQKVPSRSEIHLLPIIEKPFHTTIWVIDDGDYAIMLYPNEY
jgi:hypothetical protein